MREMTAYALQLMAYREFDEWLAAQSEDTQDMHLIDQIEMYAQTQKEQS